MAVVSLSGKTSIDSFYNQTGYDTSRTPVSTTDREAIALYNGYLFGNPYLTSGSLNAVRSGQVVVVKLY